MADTIIARLMQQAQDRPSANAYFAKQGGVWRPTTWAKYAAEVRTAGRALLALGVGRKHGEGNGHGAAGESCVCILGFNRPEWTVFNLGAMAAGAAPAGIYTTSSPTEVAYIVGHTESKVVLCENQAQWEKIKKERASLPKLEHVVLMRDAEPVDDPMVLDWERFLACAAKVEDAVLAEHVAALDPAALGTLIYTSGTTGPPKGVMLSHENLAWTARLAVDITGACADDTSVSYLPLSHIAEQMFSLHGPITSGSQVYFAEAIDRVAENFKEVQPSIVFGVPRIWEKFHAGVTAKMRQATGLKAKVASFAQGVGTRVNDLRNRGVEPTGLLALQYKLAHKVVFSKVKPALGLGRARICVSGAAPISADVLKFFAGLDVVIREVYGQSEDTGPTSFNVPGRTKFGSVGPALPGVEVRIAEDGEIEVRGPNVFMGYYKEPQATADTLVDGWLLSGDLGKFDDDGFLWITGRKKDLIITAGGKNIAPKNIEASLKDHPLVGEAVVIGDRRKFLAALLSLDPDAVAAFAEAHAIDKDEVYDSDALRAELQHWVDRVNKDLARVEQVKKFTILPRPLSIEHGELTPTLKVKRKIVNEHFSGDIEKMYEGGSGGD
ncbi:MAG: long-chain fatty acid--CoA ligase [Myxococcales bacterium]|nr:long-chain fatty acid--CoA ligase [Myxococcales bacterium]